MFCQYCGGALDEGARFCKSCGKPVPGPTTASQIAAQDPVQLLSHQVHILGIVWLSYGALRIIMAVWIFVFSHYFIPSMQDVLSHSNAPFPFPIADFLRAVYTFSAIYGVVTGIFPFGTAVAIYTLIKLMPDNAARDYKQLATPN
jgi:hypothetical protein